MWRTIDDTLVSSTLGLQTLPTWTKLSVVYFSVAIVVFLVTAFVFGIVCGEVGFVGVAITGEPATVLTKTCWGCCALAVASLFEAEGGVDEVGVFIDLSVTVVIFSIAFFSLCDALALTWPPTSVGTSLCSDFAVTDACVHATSQGATTLSCVTVADEAVERATWGVVDLSVTVVVFEVALFGLWGLLTEADAPLSIGLTGSCSWGAYADILGRGRTCVAALCAGRGPAFTLRQLIDFAVAVVILPITDFLLWDDLAFTTAPRAVRKTCSLSNATLSF